MIKIAIVEDDEQEAKTLLNCIERYIRENQKKLVCTRFYDAETFLDSQEAFDMVFMDIMLPHQTGMEAAFKLRKKDSNIVIIFVTTMAQFALQGYEVNALDYILKPVSYERFTLKMRRAVEIIKSNNTQYFVVNDPKGVVKISSSDVYYIDVSGHKLTWHTVNGDYSEYGSLSDLETMLKPLNFMRCNACFLVNPNYIARVNTNDQTVILVNGEELKISQPKRKSFLAELTNWLGQGKC
ncbi:MAG TPA: DNA-binding response regulator [Clostridiales bacterium]|nr:DNA-binding response regulator [Clostridiales bacterium]